MRRHNKRLIHLGASTLVFSPNKRAVDLTPTTLSSFLSYAHEKDNTKTNSIFNKINPKTPRNSRKQKNKTNGTYLMGVDGVIIQGPQDPRSVEREGDSQVQIPCDRRPSKQCTPVERHSKDKLRPVGYPLHQRVGCHQAEGRGPQQNAECCPRCELASRA
jgi:hypothetical protein